MPVTSHGPSRRLIGWSLAAALAAGGYAVTTTPHYALYQLRRAIASHDLAGFQAGVDTESVIRNAVDSMMDDAEAAVWGRAGEGDVWRDVGRRLGEAALDGLRPQIQNLAAMAMSEQIERLWLALGEPGRNPPHLELQAIDWQGDVARVQIRAAGRTPPLSLVMTRGPDRRWRVVVLDRDWLKEAIRAVRPAAD